MNEIKKLRIGLILLTLFSVAILSIHAITSLKSKSQIPELEKQQSGNDVYEHANNPTVLQQELYKELSVALLSEDAFEISELVVKSYVADFYTWTNKIGNYEVGGQTYIYGPSYVSFQYQARDTFYAHLDELIQTYTQEELLEVVSIEVSGAVEANTFTTLDGDEYPAYYVEAYWQYDKTKLMDASPFQTVGYFTVIDHRGRFEIAEYYDHFD